MENVQTINDGFVAFVDVLGFRELVGRDDRLTEVQKYIETVVSIFDQPADPELQFVLFSDNLVVNTRNASVDSFKRLVRACSHLSYELAQQRVAFRGAVARGPFMRSPTTRQGVILAGRPIVEAYQYERLQNWVGIVMTPSVVRAATSLKEQLVLRGRGPDVREQDWFTELGIAKVLQFWPDIPFHVASNLDRDHWEGYAVVPTARETQSKDGMLRSISETRKALDIMRSAAPDPVSISK